VRYLSVIVLLLGASDVALAEAIPLPRARLANVGERLTIPPQELSPANVHALVPVPKPAPEPKHSPCQMRLGELARFAVLPSIAGPGACGATDLVSLEAVVMPDQSRVSVNPPATLRCDMAESVAEWVRRDVGPAAATLGASITAIANYDSYGCRGRNRVAGAKISEHGRGNALDIRSITLTNGAVIELTSPIVSKEFREWTRLAACGRFSTVLGPGSDGYHESHIHLDLAQRTSGYRTCQWDVRAPRVVTEAPLPKSRPTALMKAELP